MATTEFETIDWTFDDETGVGRITLNRPEKLNALSNQLYDEVIAGLEAFEELDDESLYEAEEGVAVRAVVFDAAGEKAFSVGADIENFEANRPGVFVLDEMFDVVDAFPAPTIAKVDGYCLGGGFELALACDFRLASEDSEFGSPEVNLGLIPGGGATQRLAMIAGPSRAKELCMTGERIDADAALDDGLVDYTHPGDELDEAVDAFTNRLANQPPLAVRTVKDVVNMSRNASLRVGRYYERRAGSPLLETEDHEEGVRAFQARRGTEWRGK
jgi:enoyl-CoA hydratase/carnithine racemase